MNKAEALEKALECAGAFIFETDSSIPVKHDPDKSRFTVCIYGPAYDKHFTYDPPREAPPKGTIVEVWCDGEPPESSCLRYSLGELSDDGWLNASQMKNRHGKLYWKNWRVVEPVERVEMEPAHEQLCAGCIHDIQSGIHGKPCRTCTTTKPSNFEAK